jgi:hypothetical protein
MEPADVKTVSKVKVSVFKPNNACGLVIKESFLQELVIITAQKTSAINLKEVINKKFI